MSSVLIALALLSPEARAGQPLEPQVRVHAGVSWLNGPSPFGVTGGIDARLTRLLAIDLGGFYTPVEIAEADWVSQPEADESFHLRHGLYFAPGIRIPHPQPRTWAWDVILRVAPAVVWYADTSSESYSIDGLPYAITPAASGFAGGDLMLRLGAFGVRASGRAYLYEALHSSGFDTYVKVEPQVAIEALVQF